jgi:hypothetical protein
MVESSNNQLQRRQNTQQRITFYTVEGKLPYPVTPLLVTTRELGIRGILTQPLGFWIASIRAILGLFVAWLVYRLAMPFVVGRMSA